MVRRRRKRRSRKKEEETEEEEGAESKKYIGKDCERGQDEEENEGEDKDCDEEPTVHCIPLTIQYKRFSAVYSMRKAYARTIRSYSRIFQKTDVYVK